MKIFNSMNQKVEEFKPLHENEVHMYVCGPTVYNYPHIGNARPIVVFDTLKRTFQAIGYNVKMVSNYTDVDDKIIKVAKECGVSEAEITEKFIDAYNHDRLSLHAAMPDAAPRVTETMDAIIAFIKLLVDKGHAYEMEGDVYFRVNSVESYGKLSNQQIEDLLVGARIDENSKKEHPLDFTLWKKTEEGIKWDSPWSVGRPGWHTECVVMINQEFGGEHTIDIHGGGMDLKFPHHENEIAQSEACNGKEFSHYWMHNAFLNIDNRKMSKSLGNFLLVRDIEKKYDLQVLRFFMLSAHYRSPLNFSAELMEAAKNGLDRILTCAAWLQKQSANEGELTNQESEVVEEAKKYVGKFEAAMEDDFNTADAIAAIFELVKYVNTNKTDELSGKAAKALYEILKQLCDILGIIIEKKEELLDADIEALIEERKQARKAKNFARADEIRKELADKGILLEDTRQGVTWKRV